MPRIAQIQVSFAPTEDRLLLRLNTDDHSELRFWLTRRLIKLLTPILTRMVETTGRAAMIPEIQARETVADFEREEALASADFKTHFNEAAEHLPLGETPVILARIQTKQGPDSVPIFVYAPSRKARYSAQHGLQAIALISPIAVRRYQERRLGPRAQNASIFRPGCIRQSAA